MSHFETPASRAFFFRGGAGLTLDLHFVAFFLRVAAGLTEELHLLAGLACRIHGTTG
jgi:hypothetical protein